MENQEEKIKEAKKVVELRRPGRDKLVYDKKTRGIKGVSASGDEKEFLNYGKKEEIKVFLGGTCNDSTWRDELIPSLKIKYFNPVVDDWTPECQAEEREQKKVCDIHFYCITSEMTGIFSIAEAIDSVHTKERTIVQVIPEGFNFGQIKSFQAFIDLINLRGGVGFIGGDLSKAADLLNKQGDK